MRPEFHKKEAQFQTEKTAHGPGFGRGDEDEGSLPRGGAILTQKGQGKIDRSAEALRVRQRPPSFPPEKSTHPITPHE
jgi:hypothetical protein